MTVPASQENRFSYAGNGVTTAFAYSSKFLANADLVVVLVNDTTGVETAKALTTHYTITGAGTSAGTVTMLTAPATGETLVIYGDPVLSQLVDPVNGDAFDVDAIIEAPLDKLTIITRRHADQLERAAILPEGYTGSASPKLPTPGAGEFLRWNVGGTALETVAASPDDDTFTQSGTGAVARSWTSKVGEIVSVKDFGAVGDGVTDDTAVIQAAIDTDAGRVFFPAGAYSISNTISFSPMQHLVGESMRTVQVIQTDNTKFAFQGTPVADSGADWYTGGIQYAHGSFSGFDVRARYGIALNGVNLADPATLDYVNNAAFMAANTPIMGFVVKECLFFEDVIYNNGAAWMAAQTQYNTANIRTLPQLYAGGVGILFSNVYEGIVEDCTVAYYGIGVLFYGSDISECRNNRLVTNMRHGWSFEGTGVFPSGHQTKWVHNDCLSNYTIGGIKVEGAACVIDNNYFENTGEAGASVINYYIYDAGIGTIITSNRMDDYGSTKTSGYLMYLAGTSDGLVTLNRVLDNRPGGAGNRNSFVELNVTNWNPSSAGSTRWGTYQFVKNGTECPRIYHPAIQYDLDGDSMYYAPLRKHRDLEFSDISGGGKHNAIKEFQDSSGLWYYNEGAFNNPHKFYPSPEKLATGSTTFTVTFKAKCSNTTVTYFIRWTDTNGAEVTSSAAFTFAGTTTIETHSATINIGAFTAYMNGGFFQAWLNPAVANTYSISIA